MLQAQNITFEVGGKKLVNSIQIKFKPGLLYGVVGPNGAGKSTFLKTLAGIWSPTKGNVFWKGDDIHQKERKEISKTISMVPQHNQVVFDFTVEEIVAMGRYAHGKTDSSTLDWVLKTVDVWHLRHRRINEISHGERQRVYIARALCTESPVLLLDEPTSSLDIRHQLEIWELMKNLLSPDKIIIVTTHDLTSVKNYCDHIAVFDQGQCVASGKYQQIMTDDLLKKVFGVSENQIKENLDFKPA